MISRDVDARGRWCTPWAATWASVSSPATLPFCILKWTSDWTPPSPFLSSTTVSPAVWARINLGMHPCTMFRSVPGVLSWESGDSRLYFYGSITFLSTYKTNSKGKFLCITLLWKQRISWKLRHTFIAMLKPLKPTHRPGFGPWWTSTPWPP